MICPDCEMEVEKLNTKGICKQCAVRINQVTYINRRDGTDKPYIKLKDLKKIDPAQYKKAMAKRKSSKAGKKKTVKEKPVTEKKSVLTNKEQYYLKVNNDLEDLFTKNQIDKSFLNVDLASWMETFWMLLQEDNIIFDATKAERVFNDLSYLYLHNQLNVDWNDTDTILNNSLYAKALLELRRPTKDFLGFWKIIAKFINKIKDNDMLMEVIQECRNECCDKALQLKNPLYHTEIDNELSQTMTNSVIVDSDYKYYNVKVTVKGLYGHNYNETFRLDTPLKAFNEFDAKKRFMDFMKEKFTNVKYNENNIKIEEVFK